MRAVVIPRHGPPEVLEVQELPDPPGGARRRADRGQGRGDQLRRHHGARSGSTRMRPSLRAWSATRSRARSSRWGRGSRVPQGRRPGDGRHALQRTCLSWSPCPKSRCCRCRKKLSFEQGAAFPVNYGTAYAALVIMGGLKAGRPGPDPRRRGRRRHRRHADRQGDRRRDLRHRVRVEARRDPGAGRRPRDRLPDAGLRGGGPADHGRRGRGRDHGRARPDARSARTTACSGRAAA